MWYGASLPMNVSSGDLVAGVPTIGLSSSNSGGRLAAMVREESGSGLRLVRNTSGLRLPLSSAIPSPSPVPDEETIPLSGAIGLPMRLAAPPAPRQVSLLRDGAKSPQRGVSPKPSPFGSDSVTADSRSGSPVGRYSPLNDDSEVCPPLALPPRPKKEQSFSAGFSGITRMFSANNLDGGKSNKEANNLRRAKACATKIKVSRCGVLSVFVVVVM
jgi:hypothetical protein